MNVLIAEDDPVLRRLLQGHLERWGHAVTAAEDGGAAWRLFEAGQFPLVLSDWMMPELDGPDLVRRIRAAPRPGYVYVILLTSRSRKEDVVAGMDAGGTRSGCGCSQVASSQQKPESSRAIATATIPLRLPRACLSWRQRACSRRCARQAMLMISAGWSRWRRSSVCPTPGWR